ncbi:MAG: SHOCT domain-containing protein [bacterium]|nr:SHOCT domain-containing protein [bacterium]
MASDVSFPIEVQQQDSLADQIRKLQQLREDGIISDEEMATAKAKLLD